MFCNKCGSNNAEGAQFCVVCGGRLGNQQSQRQPGQQQPGQQQPGQQSQPNQQTYNQQSGQLNQQQYNQQYTQPGQQGQYSQPNQQQYNQQYTQPGQQGQYSQPNQQQYNQGQYSQPNQQYMAAPQKKGLSTGAIIGIIAGAAVVLFGIIAVIMVVVFSKGDTKDYARDESSITREKDDEPEVTTVSDASEGEPKEAETEAPTEEATEDPTALLEEQRSRMYGSYKSLLEEHKTAIQNYTWQLGYDATSSRPVAIRDLDGDDLEELVFLQADSEYAASLYIYTCKDDVIKQVYKYENIDAQVAGGSDYFVSSMTDKSGVMVYHSVSDEGIDEDFTLLEMKDGEYVPSVKYDISTHPNSDYTEDICECYKDGVSITEDEAMKEVKETFANLDAALVYSEHSTPSDISKDMLDVSMDYDSAIHAVEGSGPADEAEQKDEGNKEAEPQSDSGQLPIDKDIEFNFASGAGAWGTSLTLKPDGTFSGSFHDSEMGDSGDGYPNGSIYVSNFTGSFKNITKIDDYTYKMELDHYDTANPVGTEEIQDDIRYVYSEPYGVEGGNVFYLYLPGKPISELTEEFISWSYGVKGQDLSKNKTLDCHGLYNEAAQEGFFE